MGVITDYLSWRASPAALSQWEQLVPTLLNTLDELQCLVADIQQSNGTQQSTDGLVCQGPKTHEIAELAVKWGILLVLDVDIMWK